jgi:adenylate kinase
MKPAFKKGGCVTAGNSSGRNDGASALIVMSREKADELGYDYYLRHVSSAVVGLHPSIMGVGPIEASREALEKAGVMFDHVISLEIPDETIAERVVGRGFCEYCGTSYHINNIPSKVEGICDKCGGELVQRDDDKPETVKHRLEIYHVQTEPLKEFYAQRGVLYPVTVTGTLEENTRAMMEAVKV